MTQEEAKKILGTWRANERASHPEVAEALDLAGRDPELRQWFEQQRAFHSAMREKFQQIEVPAGLKDRILAEKKIIRPQFFGRTPAWSVAAASVALLLGLVGLWWKSQPPPTDRFSDYQARMVRTVLREYRMDLITNDLAQIRQFQTTNGAPADYVLTPGLQRLTLTGAGVLHWQNHPVSMVCFDRGDKEMVFLFVISRSALKRAPSATPEWGKVNKLVTFSWSEGDKIYLLAGPEDPEFQRKYL